MHDRITSGEERTAAFLAERLRPALYPQRLPMDVGAWHIAGEPVPAELALRADYAPFTVASHWGRPWATSWFDVRATVPERWAGRRVEAADRPRLRGRPRPDGRAEGLVHDEHGIPSRACTRTSARTVTTRRMRRRARTTARRGRGQPAVSRPPREPVPFRRPGRPPGTNPSTSCAARTSPYATTTSGS